MQAMPSEGQWENIAVEYGKGKGNKKPWCWINLDFLLPTSARRSSSISSCRLSSLRGGEEAA